MRGLAAPDALTAEYSTFDRMPLSYTACVNRYWAAWNAAWVGSSGSIPVNTEDCPFPLR
jgi:hypothetical protein